MKAETIPNMDALHDRISKQAQQLAAIFGPVATATTLAGAALTLMRSTYGAETARNFFAGIADEIGGEMQ